MTPAFLQLLPAAALPALLEPYKRLLGVLVRQNCISLAVSNPYLNLAQPLGAVMLREGRLPGRSFQRLLSGEQQQLAGFVMAFEVPDDALQQGLPTPTQSPEQQQQQLLAQVVISQQQEAAAAQVQAALRGLSPDLLGGWYGPWSAQVAGASCRIQPPAGPAAAAAAASIPTSASSTGQQQQQQHSSSAGDAGGAGGAAATGQQPAAAAAQQQPVCSLGQQFLQTYLDSLGSLNTFG